MQQLDKLKSSVVFKFVILKMLIFTPYVYAVPKVTTVGHTNGYVIKDIAPSRVITLLGAGDINLSGNAKDVLAADFSYARILLATIRRMGSLQIDAINVVARSQYLVLWSRLGDYDPKWLENLLAKGQLFEYWSDAACFLPIEDFAYY